MLIANKYKLLERIGNGGFGSIFKGENIRTKELVAIKIELNSSFTKMLKREAQIYQYLGRAPGIPQVKWYGVTEECNYMVLPLFGDSLNSKTFSLLDSFIIGQKMLKMVEFIHRKGLIHRDIKPDNFVLSQNGKDIYIIDFGLCKKYMENNKHIEMKTGKAMLGTLNFVSVNVHNGIEPSRRDDLISLAYVILRLINGEIPWQTQKENSMIKMQKMCISDWSKTPIQLIEYLNYCIGLKFDESPNYNLLVNILKKIEIK